MSKKSILVTGGAGYIGSHVVRQLSEAGESVIVLDNLCTGFRQSVLSGELVVGNMGDKGLVSNILDAHDIDTVMHFAAHTIVPESVSDPLKYYGNNTCNTRNLLECCLHAEVSNFIFSSTAAVYGLPAGGYASEDSPTKPINAYGTSKLVTEWMLRDLSHASGMKHVALRYFNVAGSDPDGRIGQATPNATLLIKVASEVAIGKRDRLFIYGTDYDTPDGTGIRDYIHVEDLAAAHMRALKYLRAGGTSITLNCGYGHGYSVLEVIAAVEEMLGRKLPVEKVARRPGDPAMLVAKANKIHDALGWRPHYDDLTAIIHSSLAWEQKLQANPWKN